MMKFYIFLPEETIKGQRRPAYPALYYLPGATSTCEIPVIKSNFGYWASKYQVAMIFTDTSPRDL
jgi:hypothetical protein